MNKNLQRLAEPGVGMYVFFLVAFAAVNLVFKLYIVAAAEVGVILLLLVYSQFARRKRAKQLTAYIEAVTYDTENAKNNTLMNFPLPIAVFRLDDSRIVWGNEMFFDMCGSTGTRVDARISDMVPEFSGKWLLEGKNQFPSLLEVGGRKYQLHGNIIRSANNDESSAFMGITYWVDVTDYDNIRLEYERSRPVAAVIVIDNLDELTKNQPDRIKNDIRDAVEDKLNQWCEENGCIIKRYDRDRYLVIFESRYLEGMKDHKFKIVEDVHQVESPSGINATISIGLGVDAANLSEALQFANMGIELALSRGGDQAVIKNRLSFEFYGGRGYRGGKTNQGQIPRHGQYPGRADPGFLQGSGHGPPFCGSGQRGQCRGRVLPGQKVRRKGQYCDRSGQERLPPADRPAAPGAGIQGCLHHLRRRHAHG